MPSKNKESYSVRFKENEQSLSQVFALAQSMITEEGYLQVLQEFEPIYRPSGSVGVSLGTALEKHVAKLNLPKEIVKATSNDRETGNPRITIHGAQADKSTPIRILCHGDENSAVVTEPGKNESVIVPDYAHRQEVEKEGDSITSPGTVLRHHEDKEGKKELEVVGRGLIVTRSGKKVSFVAEHGPEIEGQLKYGDRVVYDHQPQRQVVENGIISGVIDNTLGDAGGILLADTLAQLVHDNPKQFARVNVSIIFDDREEGNPDVPLFGEGARLLAQADQLKKKTRQASYIVFDGHDVDPGQDATKEQPVSDERLLAVDTAIISLITSKGKGPSMTLEAVYRMDNLIQLAQQNQVQAAYGTQKGVTTSRSSENGSRDFAQTRKMTTVGFAGVDYHFVDGRIPRASLASVLESVRFILGLSLAGNADLL